MLERILTYERDAFLWLNGSHTPYWDHFMWLFSGKVVWVPLALFILFMLVYKKNWRESLLVLLALVLVITLCDQFSSHLCKPVFSRLRPTHHPDFMDQVKIVYDYRGGLYGFMSSHAANSFGFALFMSLLFRYRVFTVSVFIWALLTSYSRIYLGVHFISDIIPGALVGLFWGWLVYVLYDKVRLYSIQTGRIQSSVLYSEERKLAITAAIWIMILVLLFFNGWIILWVR